ncbi:MAG: hypothetical protein JNN15_10315 [Blastocatellia bacterium]|nr:hypothetical protein [Blastocatellia bacterium]
MRLGKELKRFKRGESGFSAIEYVIALILVMVAFITWLELTVTAVKNGEFVGKIGDLRAISSEKASELAKIADRIAMTIPRGSQKIGSVAPNPALPDFSDYLDEDGRQVNVDSTEAKLRVKYLRQWMIVKDHPNTGDISVYVTVKNSEKNRVLRLTKIVKTDGISIKEER